MRRFLLIAPLLAVALNAGASAPAAEDWQIPPSAPCAGFTLGWTPPLAGLAKLVGTGSTPAPGPVRGHGLLMLFVTRCPASRIAGHASGPFTLAAIIIPLQRAAAPGVDASRAGHAAAIPVIQAATDSPAARLFARHAFAVQPADVSLRVTDMADGKRATLAIRTAKGDLQAQADFTRSAKPRNIPMSLLTNAGTTRIGVITGPESSQRYETTTARVDGDGENFLTRYGLKGPPAMASLDTDFVWNFRFLPPQAYRR